MTEVPQLYKCAICGNVVEVVHKGASSLVCCSEDMTLMKEITPNEDDAHFAHVEVIDELNKKVTFNHPQSEDHHIDFIEVYSVNKKYLKRKHLLHDEKAELVFQCHCNEQFYVRVYCNIHGVQQTLWINN